MGFCSLEIFLRYQRSQIPVFGFSAIKKFTDPRMGISSIEKNHQTREIRYFPEEKVDFSRRKKPRKQGWDFFNRKNLEYIDGIFPIEKKSQSPGMRFFQWKKFSDPNNWILSHRKNTRDGNLWHIKFFQLKKSQASVLQNSRIWFFAIEKKFIDPQVCLDAFFRLDSFFANSGLSRLLFRIEKNSQTPQVCLNFFPHWKKCTEPGFFPHRKKFTDPQVRLDSFFA